MKKFKFDSLKKRDNFILVLILSFIIVNAILRMDNPISVINAICGILYTFLAGKGLPICYLFGVLGSSFYVSLAFQNAIWGNLVLYGIYYIPMQILGYFKWKDNLKHAQKDIVKISLPKQELRMLILVTLFLVVLMTLVFYKLKTSHPILDSITTIVSIGGMYLTVRRAIEQWIFWFVVNITSLILWINVVSAGNKAYSTIIMWSIYTLLSVYFYNNWKKDIS